MIINYWTLSQSTANSLTISNGRSSYWEQDKDPKRVNRGVWTKNCISPKIVFIIIPIPVIVPIFRILGSITIFILHNPSPIMTITNKQLLYIITLFSDKRFQSGSIEQLGHHTYHTWGLDGIGVLKLASNVGRIEINSVGIQIRDIYIDQFAQNYYQESQSRCSYNCNNCLWSSSTSEDLLIQCNCSYYSSS